ncbi:MULTISPECIES: MATE family efflux transporter [unclassified Clostridium]|uniref:MATE family efflux transporter n=1 Tax=unclassified Clostridium TaxID=2614128 RepID=UPI00189A29D0|nr:MULTISPECIES: MATE family efflux transporter [unclassified Clostridium]MBP3916230.1 MATE family efflux transporter [Clostridium sp.]MEE0933370.1 MATE family efflux transporter [Clostridium sp.]
MNIQLSDNFTYSKLIKFTLPTIFMMIFTSIYGVVDGLFVSNVVGSDAFAAVNLIMPIIMIGGTFGFMIGTGGGALVSKTIGEGNIKKAKEIFSMLIYLLIIIGLIIATIGFIFIEPISKALGAEGIILEYCVIYGRILLISLVAFLLQNAFQSFLVVAEKPTMGLVVSIIAGVTNIVLDFLLIVILDMGVVGAGLATCTSQIVGGFVPLIYFIMKNKSPLRLGKTKLDFGAIGQSCLNGSSEMFTNLSMSIVNMLYNLQLMKYAGAGGVVSYGVIMYVSFIFNGVYIGYSMGLTQVVGYHYGSNNKDELKNLLKKSFVLILIAALVLTSLAQLFSETLAQIFVSYDIDLLNLTTNAIRIFSLSYIISGFNVFASAFFTGLNNGVVSGVISFLRTFVFQIIMIFILPLLFNVNGLWMAVIFAEVLALCVSFMCFVKNKTKYEYI